MAIPREILELARRYGPELDDVAADLRNPITGRRLSGTALILKTVGVETGGTFQHRKQDGSLLTSPAGAEGLGQFMPGTRREMIEKFGVDPWKDAESAIRGLVLHQQGKLGHAKGPRGYNPGDADNYERSVLNFRVGDVGAGASSRSRGGATTKTTGNAGSPGVTTTTLPQAPGINLEALMARTGSSRPQVSGQIAAPEFVKAPLTPMGGGPPTDQTPQVLAELLSSAAAGPSTVQTSSGSAAAPPKHNETTAPAAANVTNGRAATFRGRSGKLIGVPYEGTHRLGNWQSDNAVDLKVPVGTIIQMPRGGVVEKVRGRYSGGRSRFDGYQVTVRLNDGRRVFLTHLSKTHVKPGMRLRAGQAVGRSGAANGVEHLHAGVDRGDPRKLFR